VCPRPAPLGEADALEQLVRTREAHAALFAEQTEPQRDQLLDRQLGRQRLRIVLVDVAEEA
jgi:hypothetical protein